MSLKLAHLSDSHIGYSAYDALSPGGDNQREDDILMSYLRTVRSINEWAPDLVIHAGDVADTPRINTRLMIHIRESFRTLTDNGKRPLIVIAGNHDAPRSRKDICFLELFSEMQNVHIVTQGYQVIDLGAVVVHAVPHDSLKTVTFQDVQPLKGRYNILTSHGVADGSELFLRAKGREFPMPAEVMLRDWDYVALGHWHKQGPVQLGGQAKARSRIWYSGSSENISFRDLRDDDGMRRGWLKVTSEAVGEMPNVEPVNVGIRRMFRLPKLDGANMTPTEIEDALIERLGAGDVTAAVVGQLIENVSRDTWMLCDRNKIRRAAHSALHYQITVRPIKKEAEEMAGVEGSGLGQIDEVLVSLVQEMIPEPGRQEVLGGALKVLETAAGASDVGHTGVDE